MVPSPGALRTAKLPSSGRRRRGAAAQGPRPQARRRRRRRADAADPHPTRACGRRARSAPSCPRSRSWCSRSSVEVAYARELLAESAEKLGTCRRTAWPTSTPLTDAVRRVGGGGSALDPVEEAQHREHAAVVLAAGLGVARGDVDELVVSFVVGLFAEDDLSVSLVLPEHALAPEAGGLNRRFDLLL